MSRELLDELKQSSRLPTPPGTALEILRLSHDDTAEISELADTIAADPALSLRILRYANSALLGAAREVTSVRDAVLRLGIRAVRLMALSFSLVSDRDPRACPGFDYSLFWSHAIATGVAARHLAKRQDLDAEEAFAAGLLARIGKLILAVGLPGKYGPILVEHGGTLGPTDAAETARLGCDYREIGAELMLDWDLPQRLAELVRHNHDPRRLPSDDLRRLAVCVGFADKLAVLLVTSPASGLAKAATQALLDSESFTETRIAQTLDAVRADFTEMTAVLALGQPSSRSVADIQAEAGEVLSELSLAAQLKTHAVERQNQVLRKKAWSDGLTGVPNRAAFETQLKRLWEQAAEKRRPIALILIDVDHFKAFNDAHGHPTGDAVLKTVAARIVKQVRGVDFPARFGGEEFAVILPNADRLTAAQISVKIRKAVEAAAVEFEGRQHGVTVSVGTAIFPHGRLPFTPEKLIEEADKQLYASKAKGRNCCSMRQFPAPRPAPAPAAP